MKLLGLQGPFRFAPARVLSSFFLGGLCLTSFGLALASTAPEKLSGPTSVAITSSPREVIFRGVGVEYRYRLDRGGSLAGLSARRLGYDTEFLPSYYGGVAAELGGAIRAPWTAEGQRDLSYAMEGIEQRGDTVVVSWRMTWANQSCRYSYAFHLQGQTLVLDVVGDETGAAAGIGLNRAFPSEGTRVLRIPYLTLASVLYRVDAECFVSFYADWEATQASSMEAWIDGASTLTGYYGQRLQYARRTDGQRNPLRERLYLSVAQDLSHVMPTIVDPAERGDTSLSERIILSYGLYFPWLISAPSAAVPVPRYLEALTERGVKDLAIIVKDWNKGQFDHAYPCTWPPDAYQRSACWGGAVAGPSEGGASGLRRVRDAVRSKGYLFGLHENYTDYHASDCDLADRIGPGEYRGLLPDGTPARAFYTACRDVPSQSWLLKPSMLDQVVPWSAGQVVAGLGGTPAIDFSYLDVSSAVNPSGPLSQDPTRSYVDFDANVVGSGTIRGTLEAYRALPGMVRQVYGGPVQGEGTHHMLYAGYYDDLEARLVTSDESMWGWRVPLLLDFALEKLHGLSTYHGLGHIQWFFGEDAARPKERITGDEVLTYVATELAFGHIGLVTTGVLPNFDHSLEHAETEQRLALPVQRRIAHSPVRRIAYDDAGQMVDASVYVARHPDAFDDATSDDFMGRVLVEYENGVIVFVNRTRRPWQVAVPRPPSAWYSYHAVIENSAKTGTGDLLRDSLTLPPNNGWLCVVPSGSD